MSAFGIFRVSSLAWVLAKEFRNSSSIRKNLADVLNELDCLESSRAVGRVTEEEAKSEGSIIAPILWVKQEKAGGVVKNRLIHHDLLNFTYSRPKFSLARISQELERIADFNELRKCDAEKYFYQFRVGQSSSKTLRFKIEVGGEVRFYEWKVMAMGMSGAPYTAQCTSNFLSDYYSRRFAIYSCVYLDDFWAEKSHQAPNFEVFAGDFGIRFKVSKTEEGSAITLLGVDIDLELKTAKITADKAENIENDASLMLKSGMATSKQLAVFYGRVESARDDKLRNSKS